MWCNYSILKTIVNNYFKQKETPSFRGWGLLRGMDTTPSAYTTPVTTPGHTMRVLLEGDGELAIQREFPNLRGGTTLAFRTVGDTDFLAEAVAGQGGQARLVHGQAVDEDGTLALGQVGDGATDGLRGRHDGRGFGGLLAGHSCVSFYWS